MAYAFYTTSLQLEVYDVMAHDEPYTPLILLTVPCCKEETIDLNSYLFISTYSCFQSRSQRFHCHLLSEAVSLGLI